MSNFIPKLDEIVSLMPYDDTPASELLDELLLCCVSCMKAAAQENRKFIRFEVPAGWKTHGSYNRTKVMQYLAECFLEANKNQPPSKQYIIEENILDNSLIIRWKQESTNGLATKAANVVANLFTAPPPATTIAQAPPAPKQHPRMNHPHSSQQQQQFVPPPSANSGYFYSPPAGIAPQFYAGYSPEAMRSFYGAGGNANPNVRPPPSNPERDNHNNNVNV